MSRVRVFDRLPFEAEVSPDQALSYCRRVLVAERRWREEEDVGAPGVWLHFVCAESTVRGDGSSSFVSVPLRRAAADYAREMAGICDALVEEGIVSQPSEALRAMAAEPGGAD